MNHRQLFSFSHTCKIKIEVLHLRERWCSVAPENVTNITFSGSITFSVVTYVHLFIMITSPCNVYPLTSHFYIVKVEFTGVFIIFLFLL